MFVLGSMFLGFFWWTAILTSLVVVAVRVPRERRKRVVASVAAVEAALVSSTALVPVVGVFVWFPILCVAALPVAVVCDAVGVDIRGLFR